MKNRPLFFQIWLVIIALTFVVLLIVLMTLPTVFRKFFTEEAFQTINLSHSMVLNQFDGEYFRDYLGPDVFGDMDVDNIRKVKHMIVREGRLITDILPEAEITKEMVENAGKQTGKTEKYSSKIGDKDIFYIITKEKILGLDGYVISYMSDGYTNKLTEDLFPKVLVIFVGSLMFSWIPAGILSKYISKPLEQLEKKVDRLASNNWNEKISLERNDEIGKLARSIDNLRLKLIKQDEAEKTFLQSTSHELKTPIMVIQSYAEGIKDGIYPKGDLNSSLDVILQEAGVLEGKVSNLLQYNKLSYMENHDEKRERFDIADILQEAIDRFKPLRTEIVVEENIEPVEIVASYENWKSVVDNILDNQFRYASSKIVITSYEDENEVVLSFYNDGEHIPESDLESIFGKFNKGMGGNFGLGLSIVKTVAEKSGFSVKAENLDRGVIFKFRRAKNEITDRVYFS